MYGFLLIEDIKNAPIKRATLLIRLVAHFFSEMFFLPRRRETNPVLWKKEEVEIAFAIPCELGCWRIKGTNI